VEPIRADRNRGLDRRSSRSTRGSAESAGGFAARLDGAESVPAEVEAESSVDLTGVPSIDAPTEKLFDAVHAAGARLVHERTWSSAQAYREAIRRFLLKVVPDAQQVEVHESNRGILSRKRYYLLTTVNQSVDRLIQGLLQTQSEQIDMLQRLEEIEGLLVDLMQ
jgi:uncharacterized protein YaaR (DUF327 family)